MKIYELKFKVTETCKNGNERRLTKTVYFKRDGAYDAPHRITLAKQYLLKRYYYNLQIIHMRLIDLPFVDEDVFN